MTDFSDFHDERFPTAISFGATGGPERRNEIISMTSGKEKRNTRLSQSRHTYDAGTGVRSLADLYDVLAFFDAHLRAYPDAYIYPYNHYEVTALKRLASKHAQGELILDQLLRGKRFVDLYRVVSEGIIASEPGYSLKNLEAFYAQKRDEDVKTAGDNMEVYEKWRGKENPDSPDGSSGRKR